MSIFDLLNIRMAEKRVQNWRFFILNTVLLGLVFSGSSEGLTSKNKTIRHEDLLYEELFRDYNKEIRPVLDQSEAVSVKFGFALSEILDLDEKNQVLTTNVWIRQIWKDMSLVWNSSVFGNIKSININPKKVWVPDIILYNNVNNEDHGEQYLFNTKVIIKHNGDVEWYSPNKLRTFCKIDIRLFPFDTQECKATFGSWTFAGDKLDLHFYRNTSSVDTNIFSKNGEWDLISAEGKRNVIKYKCCEAPYIDLTYDIVIKRRPLFYLNNLILPCIVLALLTSVSFLFPPETGERISLVITVLLGMTVFMIVFTEAIPATSEVTPLIGKYFAAVLFEVALCLLATCVPLRLQHLHPGTKMPYLAKVLIFDYIGLVLCFRFEKKRKTKNRSVKAKITNYTNEEIKLSDTDIIENGYVNNQLREPTQRPVALKTPNACDISQNREEPNSFSTINEYIKKTEREGEVYAEWKNAISILDRLFFWLFILTFVLTSIIILYGHVS